MKMNSPYKCTVRDTGKKFIPTMIDYDLEMVLWRHGQASEDCEWLSFEEVSFEKNENFIDLTEKNK